MTLPKCYAVHPSLCDSSMAYVKGGKAHVVCADENKECEDHKLYVPTEGECFKRSCKEKATIKNIHLMSSSTFESCSQHHALGGAWVQEVLKNE